jgi:hypothetical protein
MILNTVQNNCKVKFVCNLEVINSEDLLDIESLLTTYEWNVRVQGMFSIKWFQRYIFASGSRYIHLALRISLKFFALEAPTQT